jgi:hypothetical protein
MLSQILLTGLANHTPPWAAYQVLMRTGCLLGLNKFLGVSPVGVGEVRRHTCTKTILLVAGDEAKEACGIDQLCAGLEARIKGDIHAIYKLWQ